MAEKRYRVHPNELAAAYHFNITPLNLVQTVYVDRATVQGRRFAHWNRKCAGGPMVGALEVAYPLGVLEWRNGVARHVDDTDDEPATPLAFDSYCTLCCTDTIGLPAEHAGAVLSLLAMASAQLQVSTDSSWPSVTDLALRQAQNRTQGGDLPWREPLPAPYEPLRAYVVDALEQHWARHRARFAHNPLAQDELRWARSRLKNAYNGHQYAQVSMIAPLIGISLSGTRPWGPTSGWFWVHLPANEPALRVHPLTDMMRTGDRGMLIGRIHQSQLLMLLSYKPGSIAMPTYARAAWCADTGRPMTPELFARGLELATDLGVSHDITEPMNVLTDVLV